MTATTEEPRPATPPARAPIACPRCGAEVQGDQGWCVECGLAARTRMAPTPDWRLPTLVAVGIGLAAIVALIVAFVILTSHNQPVAPAATAPVTPAATPDTTTIAPAATAPTATPPATTAPVPAATTPATTTPAATTPATTTPAATTPATTTPAP